MAKRKHVKIARRGAHAIRAWRARNAGATFDLQEANLRKADLEGADLALSNLCWADLSFANLEGANLQGAVLFSANLSVARLAGADLRGAVLSWANLYMADPAGADLSGALCDGTLFANVDLSLAKGLETVRNPFSSTLGVDTVFRSKSMIPESFLRGCAAPDSLIQYLRSLPADAPEFHSCLISFTDADDALAEQLYRDLQATGVRCWRWKEDAQWGTTLMQAVDQAIRQYDKVVVILSENSLQSEPVIREIERALQKEQRERKEVLFPIRLDDTIFTWKHELQADVVRKYIGDFRDRQDPSSYKEALARLIRDLRAED